MYKYTYFIEFYILKDTEVPFIKKIKTYRIFPEVELAYMGESYEGEPCELSEIPFEKALEIWSEEGYIKHWEEWGYFYFKK